MLLFFGGSLPAYKLAADGFGVGTTNALRFAIAAVVLVVVARRRLPSARGRVRSLLLTGAFGIGLMAWLMALGVDRSTATVGSIVVGLEPIGVALAGVLLGGDSTGRRTWLALALGFTGTAIATGLVTLPLEEAPILPTLALLGTVATFSVYTARVRRAAAGVDPLAVAAITQVGALAFGAGAILFDLADDGVVRAGVDGSSILAVLFLGLGSAVAYLLLCLVLSRIPTGRVAVSLYLIPLIGVALAFLVVGEQLHLRHLLGAAVVLVAVAVNEGALRRRRQPA